MTDFAASRRDSRPDQLPPEDATPIQRWKLWQLALLALVAMGINDVLYTIMVVFESRQSLWVPGIFDVAGWLAGLLCSYLALDSILRHGVRSVRSRVIILAVSVANYLGTVLGIQLSILMQGRHT